MRPNSSRAWPISSYTDWSSIGEIPTRLDLEEEEVIAIDDSDDDDDDYVPPEPSYEPGSTRPEPREEWPSGPSIFTDSINGPTNGRGRGIRPVQ